MKKAIELIETREGCAICEDTPRYIVMFRGSKFSELYFNMTGYTGRRSTLPWVETRLAHALLHGREVHCGLPQGSCPAQSGVGRDRQKDQRENDMSTHTPGPWMKTTENKGAIPERSGRSS